MLKHLNIQNYALIEQLDLDLETGFSVITGETGAGKSILLGAIGLLLGQRADTKAIRQGAPKCVIEATFNICGTDIPNLMQELDIDQDGDECIIRRELTNAGKSRAFINDTPASVNQLRALGNQLIDIHSQHQNLLLANEDFQLNVLDLIAKNQETLANYKQTFAAYKSLQHQLNEAKEAATKQQEEQDYITFQFNQLEEANLEEGEDEQLEQEQHQLEHAEEIKKALLEGAGLLDADGGGVLNLLREALHQIQSIEHVYPDAEELVERMNSARIELKDIAEQLESNAEDVEFNPERQAFIDERLSLIYDLEHKHHVESVSDLLRIKDELDEKLNAITHSEENIEKLEAQVKVKKAEVDKLAAELSKARVKVAKTVETEMCKSLVPLGMPNIRFQVELQTLVEPTQTGIDKATFLFTANKNAAVQPISQIASGGEIARVMLSLKALISSATSMPTIIFDEIDTGVSGQIAERMALIMKQMGEHNGMQVISITHLPQIAALGEYHYRVYKQDSDTETNSHINLLTQEERVEEIAHMLSGSTITQAALDNAKELLKR